VVRRSEQGWQVGDEQVTDLTSAMVLADLLAADLGSPAPPPAGISGFSGPRRSTPVTEEDEAARLAVTIAQLEHALAARVRVEQAIGVLAERHRLRPRQAFDLQDRGPVGRPARHRDRGERGGQRVKPAAAAARGTGEEAGSGA